MTFPNIQDIRFAKAKSQRYFLDTNVWLALVSQILEEADKKYTSYIKFIDLLLSSQLKPAPKIILCNLQVSEVINAYLRQIAMNATQWKIRLEIMELITTKWSTGSPTIFGFSMS
jgi:hypothetical protein